MAGDDLGLDGDVGLEGELVGEGVLELQHVLLDPREGAAARPHATPDGRERARAPRILSRAPNQSRGTPVGELVSVDENFVEC
jgi:hypothetical protein